MKTYFLIIYTIDIPGKPIKSAIVSIDLKNSDDWLIKDLAELAFEKIEQRYPDNKLFLIDYKCLGHNIEFIDI